MADCPVNLHPRRAASRFDSSEAVTRCLVLQTDHPRLVRAALEALRKPSLYPGCKLALVCRQEDFESFQDLSDVELLAFPRRGDYRIVDLWRRISEFSPDLISAVFNRRPVFRKQKLLFFLLPVWRRLIFDGQMQAYDLRLANFQAILRRSRYEEDLPEKESTILFLPTESDAASLEVLGRLRDRKIVGPGQVRVFCSITKKTLYESRPEVSEVVTYESGQTLSNLRTILRLARMRVGVSAAIFSGRPVFRLHKLMFLLLPARARLVFNEHRDCWYLRRTPRGLVNLWRTPWRTPVVAVLQVGLLDPVSADRVGRCFSGGSGTAPGPEDRGSRPHVVWSIYVRVFCFSEVGTKRHSTSPGRKSRK